MRFLIFHVLGGEKSISMKENEDFRKENFVKEESAFEQA